MPLDATLGQEFRRLRTASASLDEAQDAKSGKDLLGGVVVVTGKGFVAVPYFAWANRGKGEMAVWVRRD